MWMDEAKVAAEAVRAAHTVDEVDDDLRHIEQIINRNTHHYGNILGLFVQQNTLKDDLLPWMTKNHAAVRRLKEIVHQLQTDTTAEMARLRHELSQQHATIKAHDTAAINQARLMTEREEKKSSWFGSRKRTPSSTDHIGSLLRMGAVESGTVNVTVNNGHTIQGNMNSHSLNLGKGGAQAISGAGTAIAGLALQHPKSVATIAKSLKTKR